MLAQAQNALDQLENGVRHAVEQGGVSSICNQCEGDNGDDDLAIDDDISGYDEGGDGEGGDDVNEDIGNEDGDSPDEDMCDGTHVVQPLPFATMERMLRQEESELQKKQRCGKQPLLPSAFIASRRISVHNVQIIVETMKKAASAALWSLDIRKREHQEGPSKNNKKQSTWGYLIGHGHGTTTSAYVCHNENTLFGKG